MKFSLLESDMSLICHLKPNTIYYLKNLKRQKLKIYKILQNFVTVTKFKTVFMKESIFEKYDEIFECYEVCGIIKRVAQNPVKVHYLSHRPVLNESKKTTKIRAEFNASCTSNGPSLNNFFLCCFKFASKNI